MPQAPKKWQPSSSGQRKSGTLQRKIFLWIESWDMSRCSSYKTPGRESNTVIIPRNEFVGSIPTDRAKDQEAHLEVAGDEGGNYAGVTLRRVSCIKKRECMLFRSLWVILNRNSIVQCAIRHPHLKHGK